MGTHRADELILYVRIYIQQNNLVNLPLGESRNITRNRPSAQLQVRTRQPREHKDQEDGPLGETGPAKLGVEPVGLGEVDGGQAGEPVRAAGEGGEAQRVLVDGGRGPQQQRPPRQEHGRHSQHRAETDGLRVVESAG